ncbi:restriction endonuclease subunit S [uncultured Sphingopyxis sp.]|uniref:restriction endonuclease subunit S n=1 Tax=uncultured Sphingopyxis sp. TaxID=310581 RepID=UPI0025F5A92A|nr:restriction endonuclease subunit S [uncultured Sphingopyxis sp.]
MAEVDRDVDGFPDAWRSLRLGDVARLGGGTTPARGEAEYWDGASVPWVTPSDITSLPTGVSTIASTERMVSDRALAECSLPLNPPGTVLMTSRATIGFAAINSVPMTTNQGFITFTTGRDLDAAFLLQWLIAQRPNLVAAAGGSTFKELSRGTAKLLPIDLPPLDEQRRIAEVLQSVDEAITTAQAALTANESVHRLLLDALFGICFSAKDSGKAATIGQVCERVTYGFTNPMPTTDEGPWMLTAANVRHGWIDYNSARHTSPAAYSNDISDKSRPPVGAVLVTKDGTLGRVARVDRGDVCINQSVAVLIPSAKEIDGSFLSYLLQCPTGQERMLADSGGSSVKHIYISKLAELPFALPPMDVQQERTVLAKESEHAVREQASAVEALSVLKSELMSDLLSGRVRVPA